MNEAETRAARLRQSQVEVVMARYFFLEYEKALLMESLESRQPSRAVHLRDTALIIT